MIYYFLQVAEVYLPLPPANQLHSGTVAAACLGETNRTVTFWKYPCIFVALQLFYESQNAVPCIIDFWREEATVEPRWRQRDLLIHKLEYVCGHIGSISDTSRVRLRLTGCEPLQTPYRCEHYLLILWGHNEYTRFVFTRETDIESLIIMIKRYWGTWKGRGWEGQLLVNPTLVCPRLVHI